MIRHLRRVLDPEGVGRPADAQLLERFLRDRDGAAFESLVWRHGGMVLDLCQRLLRHAQDAEDAFQATFLILVRKAHTIGKRDSVGSWLYKVAYRVALEAKTRSARRTACERQAPVRSPAGPEAEAVWRELRPVLDDEVSRLPEKYRAAFILCCLEGKSLEEAATQLGCPRATVGTRVARARTRLRGRLVRRGVVLSAAGLAAALATAPASASCPAALVEAAVQTGLAALAGGAAAPASITALAAAALKPVLPVRTWLVLLTLLATLATAGTAGLLRCARPAREPEPAPDAASRRPAEQPGPPWGWSSRSDHPAAFAVGRDAAVAHGGEASGYVQFGPTDPEAFGVLRQTIRAEKYRGRRVRLTGWLRTRGEGRAGLWMRVDGEDLTLALDNMEARPATGTTDWARRALVLDVPAEACEISFGVWRKGPGRAWVDDLVIEPAGADAATTNILSTPTPIYRCGAEPPANPVNLDFEDPTPTPPAPESPAAWVGFHSRESGHAPVLVVTREDGTVERYPAVADAVVLSYSPDQECGRLGELALSLNDTNRTLVRFDAPAAGKVRQATLVLRSRPSAYLPRRPFAVGVHALRGAWAEDDVTWNNQPAYAPDAAATATLDPLAREVRIDVTRLVRGPGASRHGWLLKVLDPLPGAAPALPSREPERALLALLPWEKSVAGARRKARDEKKLVLACVRAGLEEDGATPDEQMLLATALADPDVLALVRARFVPIRVRYRPWEYQEARRGHPPVPDPLRELGVTLAETRAPALVVVSPDGAALAHLTDVKDLDRDAALRFLLQTLPPGSPSTEGQDAWALLAAGRLDEAARAFPTRGAREAAYGASRLASLHGDYERALRLAEPLARSAGAYRHEGRYESAYALMRLGRAAALPAFREVVEGPPGPRSADAAYYMGCLLFQGGDVDGARAVWAALAAKSPDTAAAARARARLARPGQMARTEHLAVPPAAS
jgi:RNA polymerase sigma factor (sigma-70 family)